MKRAVAWWVLVIGSVSLSLAVGRAGAQVIWVLIQEPVARLARWLYAP